MPNDKEFELDDLESFSFDDLSLDDTSGSLDDTPGAAGSKPGEDPFGVWVKSAPEDVGTETVPEPLPPDEDPILSEEDSLSSEELANLDDSFDFVTVNEVPLEGEVPLEDEMAFLDTPEALEAERAAADTDPVPSFDEVSLDDFVTFDEAGGDEPPTATFATEHGPEVPQAEDELNEDFLDIDIDIEDDINDEELEIIEGALPRNDDPLEEISMDSFTAQDVDLSEFGDFEEVAAVAPEGLDGGEDLPEVLEVPDLEPEARSLSSAADFTADPLPPADDELDLVGDPDAFFEETVLEDVLPTLEDQGPVTLDLEPDDHTDLDHIMALEEDLTSGIRTPEPAPRAPEAGQTSDLAALILGKIEQELSSIKQEITELKREVTHLRAAPAPAPVVEVAPAEALPEAEAETKPHGFFDEEDEEDDETIALTGDELDNLLSTAEISEGEEAGVTLDEDLLSLDDEGNLLAVEPVPEPEAVHVTDEEFFAGTALDMNTADSLDAPVDDVDEAFGDLGPGVPESIELEEGLPDIIEDEETEDLLASAAEDLDIDPLPEGILEGTPEPLEIPFDEDIGLELADLPPLDTPILEDAPELSLESLPDLEAEPEEVLPRDPEGWSSPALEEELLSEVSDEPAPAVPAPVPVSPIPSTGGLPSNLKDELRAVLSYMDKLLASLPDDKIQEFAESEHFEVYKRLFEELGLIE